jgi:biotin carboxyl carrier protein
MAEEVLAEMVSTVYEIVTQEGATVREGDTLVMLESMKMEIPVVAESDGTVTSINVKTGDVLQKGDLIAVIS